MLNLFKLLSMRKKFTLIILSLFTVCSFALAQNVKVTGRVSDKDGLGLPAVSVRIKGTSTVTSTDIKGQYQIYAMPDATLVFSSIGLTTQEVAVNKQTTINVV